MVTYWKDRNSNQVISFATEWDAQEMKRNPEYFEISAQEYKEAKEPKPEKTQKNK